jgi:hypothetical protein
MRYYAVLSLETACNVQITGQLCAESEGALVWTPGQVGALAVFDSRSDALKYADGCGVIELEAKQ